MLDFGLAKALAPEAASATGGDQTASPTITSPLMMTGVGMILGTAAYMAPEQAKGRPADKRCDVWAFGCVLYEMLTGKRAFDGEDVSDTLAAVLRGEPDWAALPATVPASIRTLIQRLSREGSTSAHRRHLGRAVRPRRPCERRTRHGRCRQRFSDDRATTTPVAPPRDADGRGHRGRCRGWHGRLARDASDRASRHAFRPLSNRCCGVVAGRSVSRPRDRAGRHAHRLQGKPEPPARSSSCAHWTNSNRRRSRASARRARRSSRRMDNGSASSKPVLTPSLSRRWPSRGGPALPLCRLDRYKPGRHLG